MRFISYEITDNKKTVVVIARSIKAYHQAATV